MFKGLSKEFKEELERFNRETEFFCFSCSDLELGSYSGDKDKKCYLYSGELKSELNKVIQELKKPEENIPTPRSIFFSHFPPYVLLNDLSPVYDFNWWVIFPKDSIYQMAKRGKEQGRNSFLVYEGEGKVNTTATLPFFFCNVWFKEDDLIHKFEDKLKRTRNLVWDEIRQVISKVGLDVSDLEINYLELLPDNCRCEVEVNLDGTLKNPSLWESHVNNCLGRTEEEFAEFKNQMLSAIQQGKSSFDNYLNSIINELETVCKEKGVEEDSFWGAESWKKWLRDSSSRWFLQSRKKGLLDCIENLAKLNAEKLHRQEEADKIAEESAQREARRQARDKYEKEKEKFQEQARAERENLRKEQEKERQEETRERTQRKQKESQQQEEKEKQQKQQEENVRKQQEEKQKRRPQEDPRSELTLNEVQKEVQKDLEQSLNNNHLQTNDLPEEFQRWTEKLKKFKSKEEIFLYQDFILDAIARIVEERKINNQEQPKSDYRWSGLMILGGIFSVSLFLLLLLKKIKFK
jgi:hypothetical protein